MNIGKFNDTEVGSTYNYTVLVTEMTEKVSKTDKPFVNFVFSDGVDRVTANFFDKTEETVKSFGVDVGKVVDLTFSVKTYNNKKNYIVENVAVCRDPEAKVEKVADELARRRGGQIVRHERGDDETVAHFVVADGERLAVDENFAKAVAQVEGNPDMRGESGNCVLCCGHSVPPYASILVMYSLLVTFANCLTSERSALS